MSGNYAAHRSLIRSGDLLAWSHRGFRTWYDLEVQAVRAFTRSEYSHVGIAWDVGRRLLVLEAVQPMIRIFPLSELLPCYWLSRQWTWTTADLERALLRVGQKYSKWDAVKSFFGKVVPGADDRWQCAEYVVASLALRGFADVKAIPTAVVQFALEAGASMKLLTGADK